MNLSRPARRFFHSSAGLAAILILAAILLAACGGGGNGGGGEATQSEADVISGTGYAAEGGVSSQVFGNGLNPLESLAEFLGISRAQLEADLQTPGATQAGVAAIYGKTREQLKSFLIEQNTAFLEAVVKDGAMPQDRADALREAFAKNIDAVLDGTGAMGAPVFVQPGEGKLVPGSGGMWHAEPVR